MEGQLFFSHHFVRLFAFFVFYFHDQGPSVEKLSPLVHSAMPILIVLMRDPHVMVKDSATWTIGKICELHGPSIPTDALNPLVEALLSALKDSPTVCSKACFALHNFGEQFEVNRDADSNALSPYFGPLVQELLVAIRREDGGLVLHLVISKIVSPYGRFFGLAAGVSFNVKLFDS